MHHMTVHGPRDQTGIKLIFHVALFSTSFFFSFSLSMNNAKLTFFQKRSYED